MDKTQLQEFINALGMIAETALVFYRSVLAAKATPEEAIRLTQAFIAATLYGRRKSYDNRWMDYICNSCSDGSRIRNLRRISH